VQRASGNRPGASSRIGARRRAAARERCATRHPQAEDRQRLSLPRRGIAHGARCRRRSRGSARSPIPPAWTGVWISPDERGHLQASGRDARGRKQYRYHARWREVRDETKYDRMIAFALAPREDPAAHKGSI
jgi:hypothetical protein